MLKSFVREELLRSNMWQHRHVRYFYEIIFSTHLLSEGYWYSPKLYIIINWPTLKNQSIHNILRSRIDGATWVSKIGSFLKCNTTDGRYKCRLLSVILTYVRTCVCLGIKFKMAKSPNGCVVTRRQPHRIRVAIRYRSRHHLLTTFASIARL